MPRAARPYSSTFRGYRPPPHDEALWLRLRPTALRMHLDGWQAQLVNERLLANALHMRVRDRRMRDQHAQPHSMRLRERTIGSQLRTTCAHPRIRFVQLRFRHLHVRSN